LGTNIFAWIAPSSGSGGASSPWMMMMPLVLIMGIFYFLIIRPQAKRQKEHRQMLNELKKGDTVVAAGGILGTVAGLKEKENTVIIKIDENVKIEVLKSSVSSVVSRE
jgi:preprotein translocase subunit YajC